MTMPASDTAVRALAALAQPIRAMLGPDDRNVWDLHAAVASVIDVECGGPTRCGPCALEAEHERRQRYEAELASLQAQHRESAARIGARQTADRARRARRAARELALAERTAQTFPGAKCRVCATSADGSRSCHACGATGSPPRAGQKRLRGRGQGSTATRAPRRSEGSASATPDLGFRDRQIARLSPAQRTWVSPIEAYFDEINRQLEVEEASACLGD